MITVRPADVADAEIVHTIIEESFRARPVLDPPAPALAETVETVRTALSDEGGLLGFDGDRPVATLLFRPGGHQAGSAGVLGEGVLGVRRVGVLPEGQHSGIGQVITAAAEDWASRHGFTELRLIARAELPNTVHFWTRRGYVEVARVGTELTMAKPSPVRVAIPDPDASHRIGEELGRILRPGDLVILTGNLGAGKTTLTQGIGAGLGVRGAITSPTFVIARVHPPLAEGPALVHVDAYRLGDSAELDDLDLDTDLDLAVTVVEWGEGLAESLAEDRLEIELDRPETVHGAEGTRTGVIRPRGRRWLGVDLSALAVPRSVQP